MSIFDNYNNLSPNYIPDNISEIESVEKPVDNKPPRLVFDAKNQFVGYCWYNGEEFDFVIETTVDNQYMQGKSLMLKINTFRGEPILERKSDNSFRLIFRVDSEVNKLLPSGYYKGILQLLDGNNIEVFDKFTIAVL